MNATTINYVQQFTDCPGGRYRDQGDFSGEEFRDDVLVPALRQYDKVTVNLDGACGYASGFLSEAFGEALLKKVGKATLSKLVVVLNDDPTAMRAVEKLLGLTPA